MLLHGLNDLQMDKLNELLDQDGDNNRDDHCFSINDLNKVMVSSENEMNDAETMGPGFTFFE
jgi:hypothetical protein